MWNNIIHYYYDYYAWGTEHIKFTTDTIIDSFTYKKVERSLDENQQNWLSYGYIRENEAKQIFYKIAPADTERLLYDLNALVNDSIKVYTLNTSVNNYIGLQPYSYIVSSIDSILIGQSYLKRINLSPQSKKNAEEYFEQWIDSIGSLGGMLHHKTTYCGCDYYALLCFYDDGIMKYNNPSYPSCYITTVGINESFEPLPTISIYPNPIIDKSTLEIQGVEESNSILISMYNVMGNEVYANIGGKKRTICKNNLLSGIYCYRIIFNNVILKTGKIIIN